MKQPIAKSAKAAARSAIAPKKPATRPGKPAVRAANKPVAKKAAVSSTAASLAKAKAKAKPAANPAAAETRSGASAAPSAPATAAAPKQKLVRDSFTMPRADFDLIDQLKARALAFQRPARKSELLRSGLHALASLTDAQLRRSLDELTPLKAGRPRKPA